MPRDPRYDVLFESVQIGPVRAPNRFYQVPHCTGLGYLYPESQAELRAVRAEGGWGVVSTQACEIHHTSDHLHRPYDRLWDESDVAVHARMVDKVHSHGALAAAELTHSGINSQTFYTRKAPLGSTSIRGTNVHLPWQSRAMDKQDIRNYRAWHRAAAIRAKKAGFDIVYVYAAHGSQLPLNFLCRRFNARTDEYGGSLENRARLLKELLVETKEAVGDTCAVAFRFSVDEMMGSEGLTFDGEGRDVVEMFAELPDLWDVNIAPWSNDSATSRFEQEGFQESYVDFVKKVTTKPVVGVGRFTSPDTMVSQINRGILDFIGAARPAIADPFLPKKIREGRPEDIRECIGCNVCVSAERFGGQIQCTQNPTVGEEWRRGWNPETIAPKRSGNRILVIGAGPAGLECALALGNRGYEVALAESSRELGGRVARESRLPGLSSWMRVRDYRAQLLEKLPNVAIYRESELSADDVFDLGFNNIVTATGSHWRTDGLGGSVRFPVPGLREIERFSPDDVMAGAELASPVLVYDDDHNYMATVLCEQLRRQGKDVIFATPLCEVAAWTNYTMEQPRVHKLLLRLGVQIKRERKLVGASMGLASFERAHTGNIEQIGFGSLLLVTTKEPNDTLYQELIARKAEFPDHHIDGVDRIGDCVAPALIAAAVFSGHEFARTFEEGSIGEMPFRRER